MGLHGAWSAVGLLSDVAAGASCVPDWSPVHGRLYSTSERDTVVPMVRFSGCIRSYKAFLWLVAVGVGLSVSSHRVAQQSEIAGRRRRSS